MPKKFEVDGPVLAADELEFFLRALKALDENFPTNGANEPAAASDGAVVYYFGDIPVLNEGEQVAVISDEFSHGWTIQFGTETEA